MEGKLGKGITFEMQIKKISKKKKEKKEKKKRGKKQRGKKGRNEADKMAQRSPANCLLTSTLML